MNVVEKRCLKNKNQTKYTKISKPSNANEIDSLYKFVLNKFIFGKSKKKKTERNNKAKWMNKLNLIV